VRQNVTMRLHVQCYAGRKFDERPLRCQLDDHEYLVEEVVGQWYGSEHAFFKLRATTAIYTFCVIRHPCMIGNDNSFRAECSSCTEQRLQICVCVASAIKEWSEGAGSRSLIQ
jgi:hypothetical protein